jgi:hypothetical protein
MQSSFMYLCCCFLVKVLELKYLHLKTEGVAEPGLVVELFIGTNRSTRQRGPRGWSCNHWNGWFFGPVGWVREGSEHAGLFGDPLARCEIRRERNGNTQGLV